MWIEPKSFPELLSSLGASAKHGPDCDQVARVGMSVGEYTHKASRLKTSPGNSARLR